MWLNYSRNDVEAFLLWLFKIVSIKIFITVSMISGNIIDIYLLGIMVVYINWLIYSGYFGLIGLSLLLYFFLTKMELFLIIPFLLECFSIIFQSITLSNRLSINILAGSLLIPLLSVTVIIFSNYLLLVYLISSLYFTIYSFEMINSLVQLFIFTLLCIEYLIGKIYVYGFLFLYSNFYKLSLDYPSYYWLLGIIGVILFMIVIIDYWM